MGLRGGGGEMLMKLAAIHQMMNDHPIFLYIFILMIFNCTTISLHPPPPPPPPPPEATPSEYRRF